MINDKMTNLCRDVACYVSTFLKQKTDMKKQIIPILSLLVLTLFSCGGNNQNNENTSNTDAKVEATIDNVKAQLTDMVVEDDEPMENVAEELFKKLYPEIKDTYSPNPFSIAGSYDEECEGCSSGEEVDCFPLNDGGYLVAFTHDFGGPGCATEYYFWTKYYKDGELTDEVKDILPQPALDELLNPDKTEDYKNDIAEFRKMFEKSPVDFICYDFQPPVSLTVRLNPWDCEEAYYNMDKVRLDSYQGDQLPVYLWDGEKFVKE